MSNTPMDYGKMKGYFGTTLDVSRGGVFSDINIKSMSDEITLDDGHGEAGGLHKYKFRAEGSMTLTMLKSADAEAARAAITVGAILTLPEIEGLPMAAGLCIVDDVDIKKSNSAYATMTVSFKIWPSLGTAEEQPAA